MNILKRKRPEKDRGEPRKGREDEQTEGEVRPFFTQ